MFCVMFVYRSLNGFSCCIFFLKQKTAYEMRISDWSSDVCSSDLYRVFFTVWANSSKSNFSSSVERGKISFGNAQKLAHKLYKCLRLCWYGLYPDRKSVV